MKFSYYLIMVMVFVCNYWAPAQIIDQSPAGVMISHSHPKGGFMLSYSYMNMVMKDNLTGTQEISDEDIFEKDYSMSPQKMTMNMHMLMGMYGVSGRLTIMTMVNYLSQQMDMISYSSAHMHNGMTGSASTSHVHKTSGLGDIRVLGLYKLYNGVGSSLVASLGISLPTGDFKIEAGEHATFQGEHESYMMQLGTGSYDLLPGITWLKGGKKITYSLQLLGTIRPFNNSLDYHWGSEINVNAWATYSLSSWLSFSIRGEAIHSTEISGNDDLINPFSEPASNPQNYGGTRINGLAGFNLYGTKGFLRESKIGLEYGLPVYQNVNGIQQSYQSMLVATVTKSF